MTISGGHLTKVLNDFILRSKWMPFDIRTAYIEVSNNRAASLTAADAFMKYGTGHGAFT